MKSNPYSTKQHFPSFSAAFIIGMWIAILPSCHKHDHTHDHKGEKHGKHDQTTKQKDHDEHKKDGHTGEIKLTPDALKQIKLETAKAKAKALGGQQMSAVGRVILPPSRISKVGSRVEGRIVRWYVRLGQRVKKGQALALIDSPAVGRARAEYLTFVASHNWSTRER
jgi:cobalt-zinc-cadmium efflux system membrane fusion protein